MKETELELYVSGSIGMRKNPRNEWTSVLVRFDAGKLDAERVSALVPAIYKVIKQTDEAKRGAVLSAPSIVKALPETLKYLDSYARAALTVLYRGKHVKLYILADDSRQARWGVGDVPYQASKPVPQTEPTATPPPA